MSKIIFWGATGHARVLREALSGTAMRVVALIDNRVVASPLPPLPVFHGEGELPLLLNQYGPAETLQFAIAVGGARGEDRLKLSHLLSSRGLQPHTIIHRTAFVANDACLGPGCQVLAMSAVCSSARLDTSVIVNTAASIDHDCTVGSAAHIGGGGKIDVTENGRCNHAKRPDRNQRQFESR